MEALSDTHGRSFQGLQLMFPSARQMLVSGEIKISTKLESFPKLACGTGVTLLLKVVQIIGRVEYIVFFRHIPANTPNSIRRLGLNRGISFMKSRKLSDYDFTIFRKSRN